MNFRLVRYTFFYSNFQFNWLPFGERVKKVLAATFHLLDTQSLTENVRSKSEIKSQEVSYRHSCIGGPIHIDTFALHAYSERNSIN